MVVGDRVQYGMINQGPMFGASKPTYVGQSGTLKLVSASGRLYHVEFDDGTLHITTKSWLRPSSDDGPW